MEKVAFLNTEMLNQSVKDELVNQSARSVKWSILYNTAPRLVTPFSTLILAALLTPSDFGLVAISTFIIALANIVVDLGLGKAIIQRQTNVNESASISLWIRLLISTILYIFLWIAAPSLSLIYDNVLVRDVIRVSALALPLHAVLSVPKALLQREMQFQYLFWIETSFMIIQSLASVGLALYGFGAWAIIWGQLIGLTVSTAIGWRFAHWRPAFFMDWSMLRSILKFSAWVLVTGFQNWLFLYGDKAIAGLFLKTQGLGVYSLGFNIATLIPTFLMACLSDVAYPAFCRIQKDYREVGLSLIRLQSLAGAILLPVALGMAAISSPTIELLYKDKWLGLGTVIGVLAIIPGLVPLWSLNESAYQAIGRPDVSAKVAGFSLLILLPLLWVTAPYGLMVFVIARFVGGLFLPLGNLFIGARFLGFGVVDQIKAYASPLAFSLVMFAVVSLLVTYASPFEGLGGCIKLLVIVSTGGLVYVSLIWLFNRDMWNRLVLSLRQMLS